MRLHQCTVNPVVILSEELDGEIEYCLYSFFSLNMYSDQHEVNVS